MRHAYSKFGWSDKIRSDNGTEFKNRLFKDVAKQLGVEYKVNIHSYRPQCNGKIKGFHKYLKICIAKHIMNNMEWDEFTDLATAAYNFILNVTSTEAPFFLMFSRHSYMPLNQLMAQARRYLGTEEVIPDIEALQNLFQMTNNVDTVCSYNEKSNLQTCEATQLQGRWFGTHEKSHLQTFQEKYQDSFHVSRILGKNQLEVKDQNNHVRTVYIMDVKKTTVPEVILNAVPDYTQFGRAARLSLNPN